MVRLRARRPTFGCRAFDAKGKPRWKQPGPGVAWGVDFSADGEMLVVAYGDGTIRWLRWSDGVELLALFVEPQSRKWVAWTPTGYYMASAGGEDLIGWHVNRGWTQEADFFPASRFRALQPARHRATRAEDARRGRGGQAGQRKRPARSAKPVGATLPPVVTIASPATARISRATLSRSPIHCARPPACRSTVSTCSPTGNQSRRRVLEDHRSDSRGSRHRDTAAEGDKDDSAHRLLWRSDKCSGKLQSHR